MALHADAGGACAEHGVGGHVDGVIAVADDAAGQTLILKSLEVRTFIVHLGLEGVAVGADVLHLVDTGRQSAVISMTGGAGGRAEVAADHHGVVMDAGGVVGKLIGGDAVGLHERRVGVAARTGLGHVDGVDRRAGIDGRADIVDAVAIDADGDLGITGGEALAVHAGVVLVELVGAQAGVVGAQVARVGVATAAQLRNLLAINLALPSRLAAHGLVGIEAGGVTSVATDAGVALLRVNVLAEFFRGDLQGAVLGGVTVQAGVHGLRMSRARGERE